MLHGQDKFVGANAVSLAQAYTNARAWPRGIYCNEAAVGFLMLDDDPSKPEYFLWRLIIGGEFQGKGYGATQLLVSCVVGEGGPEGMCPISACTAEADRIPARQET
ncbi:MAG TPA: hypothetical protein EYQ31_03340 [Candidatus Handelsmanbacteria bacterium]|nr:hypothetical protein [Candidatus Handelsmanbacteria bacterium]